MKHAILGALALVCVFVAPVHARDLHPDCGVTMPCEIASAMPIVSRKLSNVSGHYRVYATHGGGAETGQKAISVNRQRNNTSGLQSLGGGAESLISRARAYMGQTARQVGVRATLWCSDFLIHITGASGVDARARSWLAKRHVPPQIGAIAVVSRGGSPKNGHVGLVSGFTPSGDPILISGNHGGRVGEGVYSARRVIAYVMPTA